MEPHASAPPDAGERVEGLAGSPSAVHGIAHAWRHLVFLAVSHPASLFSLSYTTTTSTTLVGQERAHAEAGDLADRWLAACYQLTAHVERVSAWSALLDLGVCTDAEALAALQPLLAHLWYTLGLRTRASVAPSLALAQFALLITTSTHAAPVLVRPTEALHFLRRVPVAVLPGLHPAESIPQDVVERLHHYGLSTVGHLARLSELALRHQFGPTLGARLAAIASGRDLYPLQPTAQAEQLHFHLRFTAAPAVPGQALSLLLQVMHRIVNQLHSSGRRAREVRLMVRWEDRESAGYTGHAEHNRHAGRDCVRCILREHTDDPAVLIAAARRLLQALLQSSHTGGPDVPELAERRLDELRLTFTDFSPALPEQGTFWRTDQQRTTALDRVAETLGRRHGRPLLLRPYLHAPDAVFSEDRLHMVALGIYGGQDAQGETGAFVVRHATDTVSGAERSTRVALAPDAWQGIPVHLHWW